MLQKLSSSGVCATVRIPLWMLFLLALTATASRAQIYVSPDGNDLNPGTFDLPYLTISKAHSVATAGDTIFVRGGLYDSLLTTITLSKSGSSSARYVLMAYPGERPLLDFSLMAFSSSNRGIRLSGSYWHIFGLDIKGAGDNGMHISGSSNIIEFCSFFENRDTGLQLSSGAADNQVINCDSYYNADPGYENADGFAVKLDVGTGNSLRGCRAWQNADDGFDGYLRPSDSVFTTLDSCWMFMNGYSKEGTPTTPNGDGNGFKMGGSDLANLRHQIRLRQCLAFDNRVKGFDQNNNRGSMTLHNCTAFRNGTNYAIAGVIAAGETLTLINCVALGNYGVLASFAVQQTNSWLSPFSVTEADFLSTDTAGVRAPRKADGSLPDVTFLHLASGSDLIDSGTDVGLPFKGLAPDLGAFEGEPPTAVAEGEALPSGFSAFGNFPNPFNPSTTIAYGIPGPGTVTVTIYDVIGRPLRQLASEHGSAGRYRVLWDGTSDHSAPASSGTYFAVIRYNGQRVVLKLQLLR